MARNEIQRLYLGSEADPVAAANVEAGSYTLTLGAETTASISYDDDAAAVQAALEALTGIGAGNVEVTVPGQSSGLTGETSLLDIDGATTGSFYIHLPNSNTTTIQLTAPFTKATIQAAIDAEIGSPGILVVRIDASRYFLVYLDENANTVDDYDGYVDVNTTGQNVTHRKFSDGGIYSPCLLQFEFIGDLANQPIDELVVMPTGMVQKADTVTVDVTQEGIADDPTSVDVSEHTAAVAPVQEVQRITFTGTPDSGSWTINGVTVSGGASAASVDVEAAIQDSGGFNKGCSVTGSFAGDFVITFDTPEPLSEIVVDTSSLLDSGSSPITNNVTTDTQGVAGVRQKREITFSNVPDFGSVTLSNGCEISYNDSIETIAGAWEVEESSTIATGSIASGSIIFENNSPDDYSNRTVPTVSTNTMVVTGQPHIVTVELSDEPTEGQWEMNAGSNSTMFLDWDATSSEVETEFEGMAYGYPVTVTGDAGGPWTIESVGNVTATIEAQEGDGGQPLRKSVGVEIVTVQEGEPFPDAPSGLTATAISSSRIDLEWVDESDNETGFRVEKSLAGEDDWSLVGITAANATSRSVTGLTSATEYDFRVRAFNDNDASEWSDIATAQTLPSSSSTYDPILFEQCIKIPIPS